MADQSGRSTSCDHCPRPAVWEAVTNGDHRDAYACGRHLHAVLLTVTPDGWAKVDRITPATTSGSPDNAPEERVLRLLLCCGSPTLGLHYPGCRGSDV